ncbi:SpoIIE family protein phosphatase [Algivirga pacifica]|uniref:PPM-type phosphatase domain-containing protein n=1 Tax=Algivirga pacifica TaxID=1162670 RepID=A0ABP9D4K8_9BACT
MLFEKHLKYFVAFLLALLFFQYSAVAQDFNFIHYNQYSGLRFLTTKHIAQEEGGRLLIGTDKGLVIFDGLTLNHYTEGLPSPYIKHILHRKNGEFIASTDKGIIKINIKDGEAPSFELMLGPTPVEGEHPGIKYPKILYEDRHHNLWTSDDHGIFKYSDTMGQWSFHAFGKTDQPIDYTHTDSFNFFELEDGMLYAASNPGNVYRYDLKNDRFQEVYRTPRPLSIKDVFPIDAHSVLLITAEEGVLLFQYDPVNSDWETYPIIPDYDFTTIAPFGLDKWLIGSWIEGLFILHKEDNHFSYTKVPSLGQEHHIQQITKLGEQYWLSTDNGVLLCEPHLFVSQDPENHGYCEAISSHNNGYMYHIEHTTLYRTSIHERGGKREIQADSLLSFKREVSSMCSLGDKLWIALDGGRIYTYDTKEEKLSFIHDFHYNSNVKNTFLTTFEGAVWGNIKSEQVAFKITDEANPTVTLYQDGIESITGVIRAIDGELYLTGNSKDAYLFRFDTKHNRFENISLPIANNTFQEYVRLTDIIAHPEQGLLLSGLWGVAHHQGDSLKSLTSNRESSLFIRSLCLDQNNTLWFGDAEGLSMMDLSTQEYITLGKESGLPTSFMSYSLVKDPAGQIWGGTSKGIFCMTDPIPFIQTPAAKIRKIGSIEQLGEGRYALEVEEQKSLSLHLLCNTYPSALMRYEYQLLPTGKGKWITLNNEGAIHLNGLPLGKHQIIIRGKRKGNYQWSAPTYLDIIAHRPWYRSAFTYVLLFVITASLFYLGLYYNRRKAIANANFLENEINHQLQLRNEAIHYAKTIQMASLGTPEQFQKKIEKNLGWKSFMAFRAKEIVSGDFYWYKQLKDKHVLVIADCTGHGVPAAFMSLISLNILEKIVTHKSTQRPEQILKDAHKEIIKALHQNNTDVQDGVDLGLCIIDKEENQLTYIGARRPLIYFSPGDPSAKLIRANAWGIGGIALGEPNFKAFQKPLDEIEAFYIFSDGIVEQTEHESERRFQRKRLIKLLEKSRHIPTEQMASIILKNLDDWKGKQPQEDDLSLLGVISPSYVHDV